MATLKHLSSKNADYGAAEQYLTFEHDEFTNKPVLDENGRLVPRKDYRISSLNCGGEDFAVACMRANLRYGKNRQGDDVKSHHYIISFDPRDGLDHSLTVDKAQELGERFCAEHFPGHQALVCTHPDGHNHSGNIHVHIVINSLRVSEVERKPYMDRASDTQAGAKHRCTAAAMRHFRAGVMEMCQEAGLYQIDLLGGSQNRVTEREYWAQKKYNIQSAHLWQNEMTDERMGKMAELTYTKVGDYYIPDLILDEEPEQDVFYGKYGDLRRSYLQEHKPRLWAILVNNGTAVEHLKGIERAVEQRMDALLPEMMKAAGVTEELKAHDQMAWVGLMNNCIVRAEEIILAEFVYV